MRLRDIVPLASQICHNCVTLKCLWMVKCVLNGSKMVTLFNRSYNRNWNAANPWALLVPEPIASDLPITCWGPNLKRTGNWFLEIKTLWSLCRWSYVMIVLCPALFQRSMNRPTSSRLYWNPAILKGRILRWRIPAWFLISIYITTFCCYQRSLLI